MPLNSQLGTADETTYGTPVTVSRFVPFASESISPEVWRTRAESLRAGKLGPRTDEMVVGRKGASGSIEFEVQSKGFGIWLRRMLGQVATTGPVTSAYSHTGTILATDCPQSFTAQINRPFAPCGGTNQPFTFEGCQISSWELSLEVDGTLMFSADIIAEDWSTSTSLATASYPASVEPLSWAGGYLEVASVQVPVRSWKVSCDNKLKDDRFYIANSTLRGRAPRVDFPEIKAEFEADFASLDLWNRVTSATVSGAVAQVVMSARGATIIGGSILPELRVTLPAAMFDEIDLGVDGPDMLTQKLQVTALQGTGQPIEVLYVTADATP